MATAWWGGVALLAAAAAPPPAAMPPGRVALGQYGRWGAFRDRAPARCYAIAAPLGRGDGAAFATVARSPGAGARSEVRFRLRRPAASATASVGGERVVLEVRERDAAPRDRLGHGRLAALLRGGTVLEVAGREPGGRRFRDRYALAGAASAIDAMRLACLPG